MFLFKIIGAYLGFLFHRPLGIIPGVIIGHAIDSGLEARMRMKRARRYAQNIAAARFNESFIRSVFGMFAKLVANNGGLNQKEKFVFDRIITEGLRLTKQGKKASITAFNDALKASRSFSSYAVEFMDLTKNDSAMINFMLDSLLALALADGELSPEEKRILSTAADIFGLPKKEEQQSLFTTSQSEAEDAYQVLGCRKTDSDSTIKQQFRRIAADYHPDRILSKDLPEDFIKFANQKFNMIKNAYETIKKERGLS